MELDLKCKSLPMPAVIKAIQKHPTIWNIHSEDYRDKALKEAAWSAICYDFVPGWNELPEHLKSAYAREIKKKWCHVRDYYKKGLFSKSDSKSGKRKNKKDSDEISETSLEDYEYLENLSDEEMTEVVVKPEFGDPIDTSTASEEHSDRAHPVNVKSRFEGITMAGPAERLPAIEDEDLTFFRCLLPDIKKLGDAQKFDFKLETMKLLKKYKNNKRMNDSDSD